MFQRFLPALIMGIVLLGAGAAPALVYDESMDGDLSEDPASPTPLVFGMGGNTLIAQVDGVEDVDYLTFTIGDAQALDAILLLEYVNADLPILPGNRGFHAIAAGPTSFIPSPSTADQFLGGDHLDAQDSIVDLLPILATAPLAGTGFEVPLGPGTYTYLVQQTTPEPTRYSLEFVVVPEPSAALLLLGGLVVMGLGAPSRRATAAH
jgi:hypothetical protein